MYTFLRPHLASAFRIYRDVEASPKLGQLFEHARVRCATQESSVRYPTLGRLIRSLEPAGLMVLSWVEGRVPTDTECWWLGAGELASAGELLRSHHDCVAGFAPGSGFAEGPQAVGSGQVVCHGDLAPRNTVFAGGWAVAFIDWDGIFVASPMWDLAHSVWQFAPVCSDADRWLEGWSGAPDRSARIAALAGGYGLGAGRADELAAMVVEVIAGCTRAVMRKIVAGIPAFVQMEREGTVTTLDSQQRAAEQLRPLIAHAAAPGASAESPSGGG